MRLTDSVRQVSEVSTANNEGTRTSAYLRRSRLQRMQQKKSRPEEEEGWMQMTETKKFQKERPTTPTIAFTLKEDQNADLPLRS